MYDCMQTKILYMMEKIFDWSHALRLREELLASFEQERLTLRRESEERYRKQVATLDMNRDSSSEMQQSVEWKDRNRLQVENNALRIEVKRLSEEVQDLKIRIRDLLRILNVESPSQVN